MKRYRLFLIFIFFYLTSLMVVMGNGASFLGRYLSPLYLPVANTIGLNTTWNFFSPDPAHKMKIVVNLYKQDGSDEIITYPKISETGEFDFDLRERRMSYVIRFLVIDPQKIELFLIPWICRRHPETTHVSVRTVIEKIPPLDKMMVNQDAIFSDLIESQTVSEVSRDCPRGHD